MDSQRRKNIIDTTIGGLLVLIIWQLLSTLWSAFVNKIDFLLALKQTVDFVRNNPRLFSGLSLSFAAGGAMVGAALNLYTYKKTIRQLGESLKNKIKNSEEKLSFLQKTVKNIQKSGFLSFVEAGVNFASTTTPSSTSTVDPQDAFTVWQNSVTVTTRSVDMTRISFRKTGSVVNTDLMNFKLYVDGVQVGSTMQLAADSLNQSYVTFDLTSAPKRLEAGTRVFKVLADIKRSARSKDFIFSLDSQEDIVVIDSVMYTRLEVLAGELPFSRRVAGIQHVNE